MQHQSTPSTQQAQPVIIQVVAGDKRSTSSNFASMSLDEWRKMSDDVEAAIRTQLGENDEL